jgi:hypothetical protein
VFDDNRYFDVFVEYAKAAPEDLLIRISVCNRGPDPALIHVLPTLWYRNTWSWRDTGSKPIVEAMDVDGRAIVRAQHTDPLVTESIAQHCLHCEGTSQLLFTENETNNVRIFGRSDGQPYAKDGIDEYVVHGRRNAVNPDRMGTKAAAHYHLTIPSGQTSVTRLRLTTIPPTELPDAFANFDGVFRTRIGDANQFYDAVISPAVRADPDRYNVVRQALAGMLWANSTTTSTPTNGWTNIEPILCTGTAASTETAIGFT